MPTPKKKASEPVTCGDNLYEDVAFGEAAHGPWRANENASKADKKGVEATAENNAWNQARKEAKEVAGRDCPHRCRHKRAVGDDGPPEPWYRAAEVYESMPESEVGQGWRWHAKAKMEYQVQFVCSASAD